MTAEPHPHDRPGPALRAEALESLLLERGLIDPKVVEGLINRYANDVGPLNGAKVVARAWTDPDYKARLLDEGTAAIAEFGFSGPQGEHIVVVENTPDVHHVVVCTLCSCYPWPVLGLPPAWYKDPAYRARIVREPRTLLAEMGLTLGDDVEIKVWDSSSEVRYFVLPERPAGTEDLSEEELAALVTRDAMVGVARVAGPGRMSLTEDLPVELDVDGPSSPTPGQRRARLHRTVGEPGLRHHDRAPPGRRLRLGRLQGAADRAPSPGGRPATPMARATATTPAGSRRCRHCSAIAGSSRRSTSTSARSSSPPGRPATTTITTTTTTGTIVTDGRDERTRSWLRSVAPRPSRRAGSAATGPA